MWKIAKKHCLRGGSFVLSIVQILTLPGRGGVVICIDRCIAHAKNEFEDFSANEIAMLMVSINKKPF